MRFEFPFNLIGKSTMAFLSGQSWRVLKFWYTGGEGGGGGQNKDFGDVSSARRVKHYRIGGFFAIAF